jgi:hypothetical protein
MTNTRAVDSSRPDTRTHSQALGGSVFRDCEAPRRGDAGPTQRHRCANRQDSGQAQYSQNPQVKATATATARQAGSRLSKPKSLASFRFPIRLPEECASQQKKYVHPPAYKSTNISYYWTQNIGHNLREASGIMQHNI